MLVVPVFETIIAPDATLLFRTKQLRRNSGGRSAAVGERVVIIVARENVSYDELNEHSFYPIGVSGVITDIDQHGFAAVRTQYRVNIQDVIVNDDHTIELVISRRRDEGDLTAEEEAAKVAALKKEMRRLAEAMEGGETANYIIDQVDTVSAAACAMSPLMKLSNDSIASDMRSLTRLISKSFKNLLGELGIFSHRC